MITDAEKIAKLKEENEKLTEELTEIQAETKAIEDEIEKKNVQANNVEVDKRQWDYILIVFDFFSLQVLLKQDCKFLFVVCLLFSES